VLSAVQGAIAKQTVKILQSLVAGKIFTSFIFKKAV
jgi:hypothetical protein